MFRLTLFILFFSLFIYSSVSAAPKWKVIEHDNITIFSAVGEKRTRKIFEEIELFKFGVQKTFNGKIKDMRWPLRVIVCDGSKTFDSITKKRKKGERDIPGYYQRGKSYDLIVIKGNQKMDVLRSLIFHELGHRLLEDLGNISLWLDEGYAEVFECFEIKKNTLKFGLANNYYCQYITQNGILPFEKLFRVHHGSDEYTNEHLASRFYGTSWAFVHICLFANNTPYRQGFLKFTKALEKQPASEELFIDCFGFNYREMERIIKKYVRGGKYLYSKMNIKNEVDLPEVVVRNADNFEKTFFQASVLAHSKRPVEARSYLIASENTLPFDDTTLNDAEKARKADIYAEFATLEMYAGNHDLAEDYAKKAYKLGTKNMAALQIYAGSIVGLRTGWNRYSKISMSELNDVLKSVNQSFCCSLKNKEAHIIHAVAWSRSPKNPKDSHINALFHGCRLYPDNWLIHDHVAFIMENMKGYKQAADILQHYLNHTKDQRNSQEIQIRIEDLKSKMAEQTS